MAIPFDEKLSLARELVGDIELSRLSGSALLMKANRLARLLNNVGLERFVRWELHGYPSPAEDDSLEIMRLTGRTRSSVETVSAPLANVIQWGNAAEEAIKAVTFDSIPGEAAMGVLAQGNRVRAKNAPIVDRAKAIETAVVAWLHEMVAYIHYELAFSAQQAVLFEAVQASIDAQLATLGGDSLERIDAIYERLEDGTLEAISHALTSCRRLITAVADAIYPPRDEPAEIDGTSVQLTAQNVLNRLEMYVGENDESHSRRKRLRRALGDLWDRTSAGVHSDVSSHEARFLFLDTYMILGEIVSLGDEADEGDRDVPPLD